MPATQFGHPLYPVLALVGSLVMTVGLAFTLLAITHLFHRTPQEHCVWCRRGGE